MRRFHSTHRLSSLLGLLLVLGSPSGAWAQSDAPGRGLVGELQQLYRIDLLPQFRPGSEVAQLSSYDTTGGNNDGFSGLYSFVRREGDGLVLADLEGPGVVNRIWTPTPTESMIAFYFDGEPAPRMRLPFIDLFSGHVEPFVRPVVGNEVGGYYSYLPMPYQHSLKIVYEGDDIRFQQIQYRRYPAGSTVTSFHLPLSTEEQRELQRVVARWNNLEARPWPDGQLPVEERPFTLEPGGQVELFRSAEGGRILGIEIERDPGAPGWDPGVLLAARWDAEVEPAILAPVGDFFGYAFGSPSMRSLVLGSSGGRDYSYLPMPFDHDATIYLRDIRRQGRPVPGTARVFYSHEPREPQREGRLYAAWRREVEPTEGEPYLLLAAEGRGHHIGTILQAQGIEPGMTAFFEGDDVATVDGEMRLHGTGSEDYFNGGWYALLDRWDRAVSLPLHGSLDYNLPLSRTGGYRFYLADKVSFEQTYRITIEHGPEGNAIPVDYTSVAFYYGEAPPVDPVNLTRALDPRPSPTEHRFYPQLLSFSLGGGTQVDLSRGRVNITGDDQGLVRIDVSTLPAGDYQVLLSYERGPDGAEFSLWRRQAQISEWIDAFASEVQRVDRADVGEVRLTDQVKSVTVRTRSRDGRHTFRFSRLILIERKP